MGWWLADHIKDGKRHMNFNEFLTYKVAKQYHKLEECIDQVKDNEMPLE
ncbi:heme-binding domain-containing protein, partial [Vibrio parahaemolyticus]